MDHIKVIDTKCPHCGKELNSSLNTDSDERPPMPGDASICIDCAGIGVFNDDMQLMLPDRETLEAWKAEPGMWDGIDLAVEAVKSRRADLPNPKD